MLELWVPEQVPVKMCWVQEGQVLWGHMSGGWLEEAPGVVQHEDGEEEGGCRECYDDRKRDFG